MGKYKINTEQYKLELEELNIINNTNIKLKGGISYEGSHTKIIHICSCGKDWLVSPVNILSSNSKKCGLCYTFAEWGIDNFGEDFLEMYWDYEKNNGIDPWKISYGTEKKVFIFCKKVDYHGSYPIMCISFTKGNRCGYCKGDYLVHPKDSFGQFLLDTFGITALELYWDYDKNTIDPFEYTKYTNRKVWIKCQEKDYHGSYDIFCGDFVTGGRCGYCNSRGKLHKLDSLGILFPQVLDIWSDKNNKSPYEYRPYSNELVWWKCVNMKHEDYPQNICSANAYDFRCPECSREHTESIMATTLKQVLRYEYSHTRWEYDAGFKINKSHSKYDIYVPELNLLIECQSEYHDDPNRIKTDVLKKQFAIDNGYEYIAIDNRDFSILDVLRFFVPRIDKIPDYVQMDKNTIRDWDVEDAQKLLNDGYTYGETANILEITYGAIHSAITNKILIKPIDYCKSDSVKIVSLSIDNKLVKKYNSVKVAYKELGGANGTSISSCLTRKPRSDTGKIRETAFGFKWMYLVDYENMIKDKNNKPP